MSRIKALKKPKEIYCSLILAITTLFELKEKYITSFLNYTSLQNVRVCECVEQNKRVIHWVLKLRRFTLFHFFFFLLIKRNILSCWQYKKKNKLGSVVDGQPEKLMLYEKWIS